MRDTGDIEVQSCPNGPLLVRGAATVRDADGRAHPTTRPVVAVCVCGGTARPPWCDGTHKALRGVRSPRSAETDERPRS